eukprot:scaffold21913_cov51-Phaeocystis_antarctica.AAC.2
MHSVSGSGEARAVGGAHPACGVDVRAGRCRIPDERHGKRGTRCRILLGIQVGPLGHENFEALGLASLSCIHEGRVAVLVLGIHVSALLSEIAEAVDFTFLSCSHKGRLATLCGRTTHAQ